MTGPASPLPRPAAYEQAAHYAYGVLQLAAIDAIDTLAAVARAIDLLESSGSIDPDERTAIIAVLQSIPAVRAEREAEAANREQG